MNRFRVLQFNMQFGQVWDERDPDHAPVRLEATLAEIRAHDADIILLQEVEQAAAGGVQANPPPNYTRLRAALASYRGTFAYPKADARELPFGIGLAIFSRAELHEVRRVDLPSPPIEFDFYGRKMTPTDRVLLAATTRVAGRDVRLFNTHLLAFFMLGTTSIEHPGQRNLVAKEIAAATGPALLAGDFNVPRHESLLGQFAAEGYTTVQAEQVTWRRKPYVLDHIFHNRHLRCVQHAVRPTAASDHHVIVADFEFV